MYYNFAAGSFISKKLCSRLSIEVDFYSEKGKVRFFEPPFGRLRGNIRTSSTAGWKARVRLAIRHNCTFSLALTVDTLQGKTCQTSLLSGEGGSL